MGRAPRLVRLHFSMAALYLRLQSSHLAPRLALEPRAKVNFPRHAHAAVCAPEGGINKPNGRSAPLQRELLAGNDTRTNGLALNLKDVG